MRDRDGQKRAGHSRQEHRRALLHADEGEAGFELLAAVAHKARPVLGTRNDFLQIGNHLAAIADSQGEGVFAGKESFEFGPCACAVKNRLGPTFASAQHVTVGKTAAGRDAAEGSKFDATGKDVAHVHVDGLEACRMKGGGHFDLAVHALFAQDGHARPRTPRNEGGGDIDLGIEGWSHAEARIVSIAAAVILFGGAGRVVAQGLHGKGGFGPNTAQDGAFLGE